MKKPTRQQIAEGYPLWLEYVDPDGITTIDEFEAMTVAEKMSIQVDLFGPAEQEDDRQEQTSHN